MLDIHEINTECSNILEMLFNLDNNDNETSVDGSVLGCALDIERNIEEGALKFFDEYIGESLPQSKHIFVCRFHMS